MPIDKKKFNKERPKKTEQGFPDMPTIPDALKMPRVEKILDRSSAEITPDFNIKAEVAGNPMGLNPLAFQMVQELKSQDNVMSFVENILGIDWLYPKQKQVLMDFYDVNKPYNECILVIGMRSGKTLLASVMSMYETFQLINMGKPCAYYGLPAGSEIFVFNVAVSEQQAKDTVFAQIKARIDHSEWFQNQDMIEHHNEFIFKTGDGKVVIRCGHSNSASLAGKTTKFAAIDEIARFKDTGGASSAQMVYDTLKRSTRTFNTPAHPKDGHLVSISSPMYLDDFQMQLYRSGKNSPQCLTLQMPTWEFNPNITYESLLPEFNRNPETAWRDYGAIPSSALELYFKEPNRIDGVVNPNYETPFEFNSDGEIVYNWKPKPGAYYYLGGDPAVRNDCFGLAVVHREGEIVVNDWAWRFEPQKLPGQIREIDARLLKDFIIKIAGMCKLEAAVFDTWMYPETIQELREKIGIVEQHTVNKETYDNLKELVYGGKFMLANYEVMTNELKFLELVRGVRVDHPRGGSKDVADAVANALWLEGEFSGQDTDIVFSGVNF
jgi:hypothetical protein